MRERDSLGHFAGWKDGAEPGAQREWLVPASALLARDNTLASPGRLVAKSTWDAPDLTSVEFSEEGWSFTYQNETVEHGRVVKPHKGPRARNLVMSGDDYAAFMGMWLSEGCVMGPEYDHRVIVSQTPAGKGYKVLSGILGRDVGPKTQGWIIFRKSLALYLKQFGKSHDKFLPRAILDLSQRQLRIFWEFYWLGDGTTAWKQRTVATASRLMADGLQEVLQKIGFSASATLGKDGVYHLGVRQTTYPEYNVSDEPYSGRVYCVTVPNGVVYVRRNGHPVWSGNCPAYQQYLWGVPRSEYTMLMSDADLEEMAAEKKEAGLDDDMEPEQEYRADQLLYLPRLATADSPYGFGLIEQSLVPITLGMLRQNYLLDFYGQGTIPGTYVIAGDAYVTPAQQRQLQDTLNAIAGDQAWKHRVIVLPPGSKTDPQKNMDGQWQVDQMISEQVCMIMHVQPHEIGIIPGGKSGGLSGGKGVAEQQQSSVTEQRTEPDRKWWKETAFDRVIQRIFKQEDLEWKWLDFEEDEDDLKKSQTQTARIFGGLSSIDQERVENGDDAWGFPLTQAPIIMQGGAIISLDPNVPSPPPPAAPGGMPGMPTPGGQPGHPAVAALSTALQPEPGKNPDKPKNDPAAAVLSDKKKDRKKGRAELSDRFADNLKDLTKKPPAEQPATVPAAPATGGAPSPAKGKPSAEAPQGSAPAQVAPAPATATQTAPPPPSGTQTPQVAVPVVVVDPKKGKKKAAEPDLIKGKGDLSQDEFVQIVLADLSHQYPPKLTAWVPKLVWRYDDGVKVKDMTGSGGGGKSRDIIDAIGLSMQAGAPVDPLVLVEFTNALIVANGNKRFVAAQEQDVKKLPAYIGTVAADDADEVNEDIEQMQDPKYQPTEGNAPATKASQISEIATLRRYLRKGGDVTKFKTTALDPDVMSLLTYDLASMDRDAALDRARDRVTGKTISLDAPLETGVVPFDLAGESAKCPCGLTLDADGLCPTHGAATPPSKHQQADDMLKAVEAELLKRGINPFDDAITKDVTHAPAGSPQGGQFTAAGVSAGGTGGDVGQDLFIPPKTSLGPIDAPSATFEIPPAKAKPGAKPAGKPAAKPVAKPSAKKPAATKPAKGPAFIRPPGKQTPKKPTGAAAQQLLDARWKAEDGHLLSDAESATLTKYSPDQPRDADGKFGSGGASEDPLAETGRGSETH
jgi:hypothetical protein